MMKLRSYSSWSGSLKPRRRSTKWPRDGASDLTSVTAHFFIRCLEWVLFLKYSAARRVKEAGDR
jgi:hypothetical protein